MDPKPSELFVGVIDLFAVLLPGALLSFALSNLAQTYLFGQVFPPIQTDAQGWVVFGFAAYLLGHFVFLLGSFLDKPVYDRYRRGFLQSEGDHLYKTANEIKQRHLVETADPNLTTAFKWAKIQLQLRHPAVMIEIQRLEADSKFFRSLIVVLFIMIVVFLAQAAWIIAGICAALMLVSFVRYADQRHKSMELAYMYLIAIERLAKPAVTQPADQPPATDGRHAQV